MCTRTDASNQTLVIIILIQNAFNADDMYICCRFNIVTVGWHFGCHPDQCF